MMHVETETDKDRERDEVYRIIKEIETCTQHVKSVIWLLVRKREKDKGN